MSQSRNPFEEIERLFDRMRREFDESQWARDPEGRFGEWASRFSAMPADLVERDDAFVAMVDLPGFERGDVDVRVTDHVLRIEAERSTDAEEGEEGEYLRRERRRESLQRSIRLPEEVSADEVSAEMRHGVLTVTMPKAERETSRRVEIE